MFAFCERSGGLATIDSAVGAGTSVRLYLPRARVEDVVARPPAVVHDAGAGTLAGLHVLLVEDNGEVAAGTEALLSLLGHRVTYAPTADDALRLIEGRGRERRVRSRDFGYPHAGPPERHRPRRSTRTTAGETARDTRHGLRGRLDRTRTVNVRVLSKPFDIALLDEILLGIREARDARHARHAGM